MLKSYVFLEIRVLLLSETKAFCPCGLLESCPVCRETGGIPRPDPPAARNADLLIRSLGGKPRTAFYERNLNTPVLPEGFHISRLSLLLGENAAMDIMFHCRKKTIRIAEIRLEEDIGHLIRRGQGGAHINYSSAGMPNIRIRTEADFEIGEETEVFLSDLRRRLQYLEILPGSSREGPPAESLIRCNAYAAIAPYPSRPSFFVKLRNLNSINFVCKAVNAELSRQEGIITEGGTVVNESRLWNEAKNATESFQIRKGDDRGKFLTLDEAPPYVPPEEHPAEVETPGNRQIRLMNEYGLTQQQAELVCDERSRADFFEEAVKGGAPPEEAARWMAFVIKEQRHKGLTPASSPLSPERFAHILGLLKSRRIHGSIAKQTIAAVIQEDRDPLEIIRERGWEQITDRGAIADIVKAVIEANPHEVRRIREGDGGPIQFLTGLIMKETGGLAEPALVKEILREQLSVSLVYVLSMGGAISGKTGEDGEIECGDESVLKELLAGCTASDFEQFAASYTGTSVPGSPPMIRFESIPVGRILSEEIIPSDWAILIETIAEKLNSGTANGIVVAHGTDTLPYTAPLLYWLFADSNAPIVLAASSTVPNSGKEAFHTMKKAVDLALKKTKGVYVVHGGKILSPLNLKFERIGTDGFRNWNMEGPVFFGTSLLPGPLEADRYVLSQLLEDAVNSMCVIRIYPGLRSDYLVALMDKGVKNFFLELYDTGTAGFREGPYSLKRAFSLGRRRGARFFCTSQQEGIVDFSGYASSRELWREGAVPMRIYTTETAVARFLAASIIADSGEERAALMDSASREMIYPLQNISLTNRKEV